MLLTYELHRFYQVFRAYLLEIEIGFQDGATRKIGLIMHYEIKVRAWRKAGESINFLKFQR